MFKLLKISVVFGLLFSLMGISMATAQALETFTAADATTFQYQLLLPAEFDSEQAYPTLLALPPGGQTLATVESGLRFWRGGETRGWVIISPAAPDGQLFFQGSQVYLPELLDELAQTITFEDDKVHVAGVSNGGLSAFKFALEYPERVHSLLVNPGFPPTAEDFANLERIQTIPVTMYVGERDGRWADRTLETETALNELGAQVSATVVAGEGHVIGSLTPETLFDVLDSIRETQE